MSANTELIQRLREIDAALASKDGLSVAEFASRWDVSDKTIRRYLATLRELGHKTRDEMVPADNGPGRTWIHRYVDRRRQLFSRS